MCEVPDAAARIGWRAFYVAMLHASRFSQTGECGLTERSAFRWHELCWALSLIDPAALGSWELPYRPPEFADGKWWDLVDD